MAAPIPPLIQPLLDAYLHALEPLRDHFYGIYIYGSIALGAFEERESDIDIIALTQGEWSSLELKQLKALHVQLNKEYPLGKRVEALYVPLRYLGVAHPGKAIASYPAAHDGKFSPAARGGLNAVTWWIMQNKGIRLSGPECDALPLDVTWDDVLDTMRFNLNVYFVRKAKHPHTYLHSGAVEFAVSNLCRILTTIEEGEIISKSESLIRWRERLPARWQKLIDEAWRIRQHIKTPSLYRSRITRMKETLAFITYVRTRQEDFLA
ncbi:MAG TPA: aminoglycoside adenylyltransferase domain-containing protein [Ktedonobacteraceae bacterium]|nr:aminoglycoside adenylyltransferase domain-containing protein [Ktedonobacteraceae bacterium]